MIRRILIAALSFSIACPAWALNPAQTKTLNGYLKESQIGSRSVSFKDLYQKSRGSLSLDVQREFDLYLEKNPDVKLPKAKITKFQEGKEEIVEIEIVQGKDRMTMRIMGKGDFAKVTVVHDGKKTERRLGLFEIKNPVRWLASFGKKAPWTRKVPSVQLLSKDQLKHLGPQEKQRYIDRVRSVLVAAEKVQNAFKTPGKKTSDFLWNLFAEPAYAASEVATGDCIVAGWAGGYVSNSCKPPAEAIDSGKNCIKCNTDIYGANAPCLGAGSGKLPLNATEICNNKTEDTKYAVFAGVTSKDDVVNKKSELAGVVTGLREKCVTIDQGGTALPDQTSTCSTLTTRLDDLDNANCELLEKHPEQVPGLVCNPAPAVVPDPLPQPEVDDGVVSIEVRGGTEVASPEDCLNLPASIPELDCSSKQVHSIMCEGDRTPVRKFYCSCSSGEDKDYAGTNLATGCLEKKAADPVGEPVKKKKQESFIQPWMIGLGLALVVLVMGYYQQQAMLESYYAIPPVMPLTLPPLSSPSYLPSTR